MKILGQNGLNFIASKYKELKDSLNSKLDLNSPIPLDELGLQHTLQHWLNDLYRRANSNSSNKVGKVDGKQLSTNDYTDEDKEQVASIPEYVKQYELLDADIGYVNNGSTGVFGPLHYEGIRSLGNAFSIIDMFLAKLVISKNIHLTLHDAIDITLNRLGNMCEISIIVTNQDVSNIAGLITNEIVINHEEIGKFFTVDVPIPLTGIIKKTGQSEYQNGGEKYGEIFMPMIISSNSNSMKIISNIYWEDYIKNYQLNTVDIVIHGMFFANKVNTI